MLEECVCVIQHEYAPCMPLRRSTFHGRECRWQSCRLPSSLDSKPQKKWTSSKRSMTRCSRCGEGRESWKVGCEVCKKCLQTKASSYLPLNDLKDIPLPHTKSLYPSSWCRGCRSKMRCVQASTRRSASFRRSPACTRSCNSSSTGQCCARV